MDRISAGNAVCKSHEKVQATHLCLSCGSLLCIECSFSHTRQLGESTDVSENGEALPQARHNVQPLANLAAGVIESLQLTIYKYADLGRRNETLRELNSFLDTSRKQCDDYIKEMQEVLENSIRDARALFARRIGRIESVLTSASGIIHAEDRAYRAKQDLYPDLQNGYKAGEFLQVYRNKEVVDKYSADTGRAVSDLDALCSRARKQISDMCQSKDGLEVVELKVRETVAEWIFLLASKAGDSTIGQINQQRLIAKADKHILLAKIKERTAELETRYDELNKQLISAQGEVQRLRNYDKYIDDDTFSLLADSMMGVSNSAETVFKKLAPYVRTTRMPTKLVFRGVDAFEEGTYCGFWNKAINKKEGKGIMMYSDGRIYEGYWKNDLPWGNGRWILPSGNVYEGQVHKGKFHGYGRYTWKDGEFYVGEMSNGHRDGYGMYIGKDYAYIGQWSEDKFAGYGVKSWADGEVYVGEFRADVNEGCGMYVWADGSKYVGQWHCGEETGDGVHFKADGAMAGEEEESSNKPAESPAAGDSLEEDIEV